MLFSPHEPRNDPERFVASFAEVCITASATILVLSSADQWRRCLPLAKISTRIDR
jgi:hypothetical protein